jgi:hypothetical protein
VGLPNYRLGAVRQKLRGAQVVGVIIIDPRRRNERQGQPLEIDILPQGRPRAVGLSEKEPVWPSCLQAYKKSAKAAA